MSTDQTERVRVAMAPADDPHVWRSVDGAGVAVVTPAGELGAAWASVLTRDVDLVHLHLGLGRASTVVEPGRWVTLLRDARCPLVLTLHEVPFGPGRGELDVLVPGADLVLVTDPTVAGRVRMRWGVEALVVPAPHVLEPDHLAAAARRSRRAGPWRVGVHPEPASWGREVVERLRRDVPAVEVDVHDAPVRHPVEVDGWLADLDLLLLAPGERGRSAWTQLCRDVGTAIVVAVESDEVEPHAAGTYLRTADVATTVRAVRHALTGLPVAPPLVEERLREADTVRAEHLALYRALISASADDGSDDARSRTW